VAVTLEEVAQMAAESTPKKRGPKSRHSGMWVKGDVRLTSKANRYPALKKAQEMAETHVEACVDLFAEILNDAKAPRKERMEAGRELLNRAVGTPVSMSVHKDLTERSEGTTTGEAAAPAALDNAALRHFILTRIQSGDNSLRLNNTFTPDDDNVIDVELDEDQ
jgi:hypothetical protein